MARFWESASGFWRGLTAWRVWLLCTALIAVVVLQLYVQFRFNYWNRNFFDALERRAPGDLQIQVLLLIPLCGTSIALAVTSVWGRMTVRRKWREWTTTHLINYWINNDRYARLADVQGERKIPEYRIAEDVRIATDAPIDFALGLRSSLLTAIVFIQVLWNVGGDAAFTISGHPIRIPGYLVGSVAIYSGIVTSAMKESAVCRFPSTSSITRARRSRRVLSASGQSRHFHNHLSGETLDVLRAAQLGAGIQQGCGAGSDR